MSFRLRWLRMLLLVVAVSLSVADIRMHGGAASRWSLLRPAAATSPNHPLLCDEMTGIAPVLLDANVPYPHAFNVRTGTLSPGQTAMFYVYGLTTTPRYGNVTSEFIPDAHGRSVGKVRVKPAPGSRSVAGRLHVTDDSGFIAIEYRPKREVSVDRTAIFTFTYDCGVDGGPYTAQFALTITGRRNASATGG